MHRSRDVVGAMPAGSSRWPTRASASRRGEPTTTPNGLTRPWVTWRPGPSLGRLNPPEESHDDRARVRGKTKPTLN